MRKRRQVHPYHRALLRRRRQIRKLRRRAFKAGEIDFWKRAISAEARMTRRIETNAKRYL